MSLLLRLALGSLLVAVSASGQELADRVSEDLYRERLLETVELWDAGMGAFGPGWDGLFRTNLARSFAPTNPTGDQTVISQSRAIYINVEASRESAGSDRARFREIAQKGADCLIARAWDPVYGGVFWGLEADGSTPPSDTTKQAYGQVHVVFSLAHAYAITGDPAHLAFAWQVYQQFEDKHADPGFPGAYRPNMSRSYAAELADNNFDYMLHYFEALLALLDVTRGEQRARVRETLERLGEFMTETLVHPGATPDEAFVSYWYGDDWNLHPTAYSPDNYWNPARFATSGHGIEFAWLLSRAVERGFDPGWLDTGRKLLEFSRRRSINPNIGAFVYDRLDTSGGAIAGEVAASGLIWWTHAEAARAALHWSELRGADQWNLFSRIESFVDQRFVDPVYGGWFETLSLQNPSLAAASLATQPALVDKGHIWKVSYHETMFFAEVLRLLRIQDPAVASALAFTDFEREADPAATAATGDFDGDGLSNLLEYALGSDARAGSTAAPYQVVWDADSARVGLRYAVSRTAPGVDVEPVWSADLRSWSAAGLEVEAISDDGQRAVYQAWRDASAGAVFLRLRVR